MVNFDLPFNHIKHLIVVQDLIPYNHQTDKLHKNKCTMDSMDCIQRHGLKAKSKYCLSVHGLSNFTMYDIIAILLMGVALVTKHIVNVT